MHISNNVLFPTHNEIIGLTEVGKNKKQGLNSSPPGASASPAAYSSLVVPTDGESGFKNL